MIPAILLIIVHTLLLHLIYLGRCLLIRLSRPMEHYGHLDLVVVRTLTLDSISHSLLLSIEHDSKGLDRPSRSRLYSGVMTGKYSGPVSAGQSHSLALQVIKLLLISAIIELSFER